MYSFAQETAGPYASLQSIHNRKWTCCDVISIITWCLISYACMIASIIVGIIGHCDGEKAINIYLLIGGVVFLVFETTMLIFVWCNLQGLKKCGMAVQTIINFIYAIIGWYIYVHLSSDCQ
eukprot:465584_1